MKEIQNIKHGDRISDTEIASKSLIKHLKEEDDMFNEIIIKFYSMQGKTTNQPQSKTCIKDLKALINTLKSYGFNKSWKERIHKGT